MSCPPRNQVPHTLPLAGTWEAQGAGPAATKFPGKPAVSSSPKQSV